MSILKLKTCKLYISIILENETTPPHRVHSGDIIREISHNFYVDFKVKKLKVSYFLIFLKIEILSVRIGYKKLKS